MIILAGFVFLSLAAACYAAMRRYESTQISIVIVGVVALIVGIVLLGIGLQ